MVVSFLDVVLACWSVEKGSVAARENSVEPNRNGISATWQIVSNPSFFYVSSLVIILPLLVSSSHVCTL